MNKIIFKIRSLGFQVLHPSLYPMFGVTSVTGEEGLTVKSPSVPGTRGGLTFVGCSFPDYPAYAACRFASGVVDDGNNSGLESDCRVGGNLLVHFLGGLSKNSIAFSEGVSWALGEEVTA